MQKKYGGPDGVDMKKFRNKKTIVKGIEFDSKMEADYYRYLLGKLQAGEILQIELQPKIMLQPGFKVAGQTVRAITYTPDFLVFYSDGRQEYIDVKGCQSQQGNLRYKIYKYMYEKDGGVPLQWITASKKYSDSGWIDYFELNRIRRRIRKENIDAD